MDQALLEAQPEYGAPLALDELRAREYSQLDRLGYVYLDVRTKTELVERARAEVLRFFCAPEDEYAAIFTANASAALELVGEAYCFSQGDHYFMTFDNHNSVNGIREFAKGFIRARAGGPDCGAS